MSSRLDTVMATELLAVAADWSYWGRPVPSFVPRHVDLPPELSESVALAIQGVRRCGKSTLLHQLVDRYGLDRARCAFVNFEDPRLSNALSYEVLDGVVAALRGRHPEADRLYFMFDEIQGVAGWERWLRTQLDRPAGNVFVVTGSNASLLSGELGSTLTGRHLTVELFPFDLAEARALDPSLTLTGYLHNGGFPEPLGRTDGDRLRRQYVHDIVERDVRERIGARSSLPIRQVVQMAYESAGSEMSLRRVAAAVGVAVETASGYLAACEDAYLLFGVPFFAYSERKRAAYNRKYYPVDPGLRRVATTRTGDDLGKALECATHTVLRRRHGEVYYWRGAGEVDFVVTDGDRETPVQVTWDGPHERHHRALDAFYEAFPRANEALIVTAETFPDFALAT